MKKRKNLYLSFGLIVAAVLVGGFIIQNNLSPDLEALVGHHERPKPLCPAMTPDNTCAGHGEGYDPSEQVSRTHAITQCANQLTAACKAGQDTENTSFQHTCTSASPNGVYYCGFSSQLINNTCDSNVNCHPTTDPLGHVKYVCNSYGTYNWTFYSCVY